MLYKNRKRTEEIEIKIKISSMLEIPTAFEKALVEISETEYDKDVWDGELRLIRIDFERNFRRSEYVAVFGFVEGI